MCFSDSHQIQFILFSLCGSALFVPPGPHFAANDVFQTGDRNCDPENFALTRSSKKILVPWIGRKLDVELATGTLRVHRVLESLHAKPSTFQFASDLFKVRRHYYKIDIDCVNRFNKAIHRQAADQTPRSMSVQHPNDFG